jgi:hypothetical protein
MTEEGRADQSQEDAHGTFVVTVRTPAGHEHRFRVNDNQRVEAVSRRAVEYFVAHGQLADGRYHLALLRQGEARDLNPASRLGDYDVVEGDVLVMIVGDPQVDG